MTYKEYKNNSFNLYTVKTDKFKTCYMEIVFYNKINKNNITIERVLSNMLVQSSLKYNKRKYVVEHLEDLYNASLFSNASRIGKIRTINFTYNFIDPVYTEKTYFKEVIKFPFEMIFHPNVKNNEFDERTLKIIKNRVKADIDSQKESPVRYALKRAISLTDKNSDISLDLCGNIKDLNKINTSNLYSFYKYFLDNYYCDVYLVGNLDMEKANIYINEVFENNIIKTEKLELYSNLKKSSKELHFEEKDDFKQATLICLYNLENVNEFEKNYTVHIFNSIFGGGTFNNKLNQNLREKKSLCYHVSSFYQKYDNLLFVVTGISGKNGKKASKIINSSLKEIVNGKISDEEFNNAVKSNISKLKSCLDNPVSISDNYFFQNIASSPSIVEKIDNMDKVTKKDVIELAKKVKLTTVYLMKEESNS